MQDLNADSEAIFLCSFNTSSLFTNIPLTTQICADILYNNEFVWSLKALFTEVLTGTTTSVEFSFHHAMYKQIGNVVTGSPLESNFAYIFFGYYKENIKNIFRKKWLSRHSCFFKYIRGDRQIW